MAMYRLRVLFEFAGFILASFVSFDVFHFIGDDSAILAIGLFGTWIVSFLGCLCSREDENTRFYRPVDQVTPILSAEIRAAVNNVLSQSFIIETIRYSLIGYGFIILLTEVDYAPAALPVLLMFTAGLSFFGSVIGDRIDKGDPRDGWGDVALHAIVMLACSYVAHLIFAFASMYDSSFSVFFTYTLASFGVSFVAYLPAKRMHQIATMGKFSTVSFVSLQLTVIHAGACVGCLAAIAIYKWFGCPPYALHIILLLCFRHNEQQVLGQARAFTRTS